MSSGAHEPALNLPAGAQGGRVQAPQEALTRTHDPAVAQALSRLLDDGLILAHRRQARFATKGARPARPAPSASAGARRPADRGPERGRPARAQDRGQPVAGVGDEREEEGLGRAGDLGRGPGTDRAQGHPGAKGQGDAGGGEARLAQFRAVGYGTLLSLKCFATSGPFR